MPYSLLVLTSPPVKAFELVLDLDAQAYLYAASYRPPNLWGVNRTDR
jgi:hypothetical protein